ncbi:hypothetical protein ACTPEF_24405, partial [Clostridioides difficile]
LNDNFKIFNIRDKKDIQFEYHNHDFNKIIIFINGNVTYFVDGQRMGLVYFVTSLVYLLLKKLNVGSTATIITFLCISTFIIVGY